MGKEMLMLKPLWGISPSSPFPSLLSVPLFPAGDTLGQLPGGTEGSVCLFSGSQWGGFVLQQHMEGAYSQSVFSCWEKGCKM